MVNLTPVEDALPHHGLRLPPSAISQTGHPYICNTPLLLRVHFRFTPESYVHDPDLLGMFALSLPAPLVHPFLFRSCVLVLP